MVQEAKFDTDNLIYNRLDLIYPETFKTKEYFYNQKKYLVLYDIEDGMARVGLWGKKLPQEIFERLIDEVILENNVRCIYLDRVRNNYKNYLEKVNDVRVPLPNSADELLNRLERRNRATIRRKICWINERIGEITIEKYSKNQIPVSLVETYFKWKKITHGKDYGCTPQEYLEKYHVSDAMVMLAGKIDIAIAFFCQVDDVVFFENFSYNTDYKEYSPGLLMYTKLMEELIDRRCKYLYLGGGNYIYKTRFGAQNDEAYSGYIYNPVYIKIMDDFFVKNKINTVAFYGFGKCGHSFLQISNELSIEVIYGIDRKPFENEAIRVYAPDDTFPDADAVFITMQAKDNSVEKMLNEKFSKVYYWNELIKKIDMEFKCNESTSNKK